MTVVARSDMELQPNPATTTASTATAVSARQRLAIVVPAWKPRYLEAALESIAAQTDRRFDCYIFDDAGPAEVAVIARRFLRFHYQRFDSNLGGCALIAHWNRCLHQLDHEWVWLFADDDVMSPGSVAAVLAAIDAQPAVSVIQLPVRECSSDLGTVLAQSYPPAWESATDFLVARLRDHRLSCLPDHVFNWQRLRALAGGLVDLPLAWNADDATWLLLAEEEGLRAAPDGLVLWRQSDSNISALRDNVWIKLEADVGYLAFLDRHGYLAKLERGAIATWFNRRLADLYGFRGRDLPMLWSRLPWRLRSAWFVLVVRLGWRWVRGNRHTISLARSAGR